MSVIGPCTDYLANRIIGDPCPKCHHPWGVHRMDDCICSICEAVAQLLDETKPTITMRVGL